ncbi:MAG: EF-hand domain-containing protein [Hoeflea sp.]|uniref:EF-hand domain-containing protein n=1 Tax=Hoeflea sp. TaxID=1940281 RepID=UPI001D300064|nr:EF-hand domain-containing protein [Hoeflea sp.]MBV1723440.1 EF-hand domain-containing protein [Hoeflea sp.]MBV1760210.1 EF-hand domain-containing protein [Hoeflea sp.]MBV1783654.1 EF-hand domain-containing protein [Hoeflea sp.]
MYNFTTIATALIISAALPTLALADSNHGHGQRQGTSNSASTTPMTGGNANMMQGMMGGDMGSMMRMMKMMHGGQSGMMGMDGETSGMGAGMMGMGEPMMGGADHMQRLFDADDDGTVSPEELRTGLLDELKTYDADGNGMLSLAEFETLHAAHIREHTVDRFQAFDADGDGQVTSEEFAAPADRIKRMMMMRSGNMPGQNGGMMDGEQPGSMMQNETKEDN